MSKKKEGLHDKFKGPEEESKSIKAQTSIHLLFALFSKLKQGLVELASPKTNPTLSQVQESSEFKKDHKSLTNRISTSASSSSGHSSCQDVEIIESDSSLKKACLSLQSFLEGTEIKSYGSLLRFSSDEELEEAQIISRDGYMDLYNFITNGGEELSMIRYSHYYMGLRAACMGLNQKLTPYLVKVLKVEKTVSSGPGSLGLGIVTERLGERLSTFVHNHRLELSLETIIRWFLCIAKALKRLSEQNITIISLNPKKIIINGRDAKILDLSYSTYGEDRPTFSESEMVGGAVFRAPEFFSRPMEPSMDIYSFGVIIYYIFFASSASDAELERFFKQPLQSRPFPKDCLAPPKLIAHMKQCIHHDPKSRPTASDSIRVLSEFLPKTDSPLVSLSICSSNSSSSSSVCSSSTSIQPSVPVSEETTLRAS